MVRIPIPFDCEHRLFVFLTLHLQSFHSKIQIITETGTPLKRLKVLQKKHIAALLPHSKKSQQFGMHHGNINPNNYIWIEKDEVFKVMDLRNAVFGPLYVPMPGCGLLGTPMFASVESHLYGNIFESIIEETSGTFSFALTIFSCITGSQHHEKSVDLARKCTQLMDQKMQMSVASLLFLATFYNAIDKMFSPDGKQYVFLENY